MNQVKDALVLLDQHPAVMAVNELVVFSWCVKGMNLSPVGIAEPTTVYCIVVYEIGSVIFVSIVCTADTC